MIIDSHQHFWAYNEKRDTWIDNSMDVLKRDFFPEELEFLMRKNEVDGCISIQADQSENETLFLLDLAEEYDFIKGVIGWLDLTNPNVEDRLKYFSQFEKLKGFRHIVQAEAKDFMLRNDFQRGIKALSLFNFTYDILIFQSQLPQAIKLVEQFPHQHFVLDHLGKPDVTSSGFNSWKVNISELGKSKNVYCKLSGLVTEARWNDWKYEEFQPYLQTVLNVFGPERLMYGSDWPVCLLSSNYDEVLKMVQFFLEDISKEDSQKIMGKNALMFYNIK